jgi:hypothetical protein
MVGPTPEQIKKALCELTLVEQDAYGFEIVLPQIYSNGETVVVTAQPEGDGFFIHDSGRGAMALEAAGVSTSPRLHEEIGKGVRAYDCQFSQFRVYKQCAASDVAQTAAIVGCASRLVADFVFQTETRPMFDFRRQVVETLLETIGAERVLENEEVIARSGTRYQVSAIILDAKRVKPAAYVEAVSNHQAVARKFRALYDMQHTPGIADTPRFSVFNDIQAGISTGDVALLKDVSETVGFRERNTLSQITGTIH